MLEVPGYTIKEKIAEGGMAAIYLAEQQMTGRLVVIKALKTDQSLMRKRFLQEININAKLSHSNIVIIYDAGEIDDVLYIVMEYHPNGDLSQLLDQNAELGEKKAVEIFRQILEGVRAAHRKNIIHRDLKPSNILFAEDWRPVITDFGIARIEQEMDQTRLTSVGQSIGTPGYMCPEQINGLELDERADLYSAGLIFYELLTGNQAVPGSTIEQVFNLQLNEPLPELPKNLRHWQRFLSKLTHKKPEERFPDVDTALQAMQDVKIPDAPPQELQATQVHEIPINKSKKSFWLGLVVVILGVFFLASYFLIPKQHEDVPVVVETRDGTPPGFEFYAVRPAHKAACRTSAPYENSTETRIGHMEMLDSDQCFSLKLTGNMPGKIFLLSEEQGQLARLYPDNCRTLGYGPFLELNGESYVFPRAPDGTVRAFEFDGTSIQERIYALILPHDLITVELRSALEQLPDLCANNARVKALALKDLQQLAGTAIKANYTLFEVVLNHQ